jgi:hypothetical protein
MVRTASASRQFHLIDAEPAGGVEGRVLRVPDGLSRLLVDGDDTPRLLPDGAAGTAGGVVIEPITRHREMLLLIVSNRGEAIRVNGATVGRLAAVREMDVVQLGESGRWFHVVVHASSVKGPAPASRINEACVLCKRPLGESVVYICSVCGNAVHCDTGEGVGRFNCMLSDTCPSCQAPVLTDGYTALPEDVPT